MKWIFLIFIVIVMWTLYRFLIDYNKQRNAIASHGGIKVIYKYLIDGLLEYSSARIVQDKKDFVTVGGTFTDPIFNRECGLWSVFIQPTFKTLSVKYQAHNDLDGGQTAKCSWDFPIDMSQEDMLAIIKKKTDEWNIYGIVK